MNNDCSVNSALRYGKAFEGYDSIEGGILGADDRTLSLDAYLGKLEQDDRTYFGQVDLNGKFKTGSIEQNLLFGLKHDRFFPEVEQNFEIVPLIQSLYRQKRKNPSHDSCQRTSRRRSSRGNYS